MPQSPPAGAERARRPARAITLAVVLGLVLLVAIAALVILAERSVIGAHLAEGYLRRRGVASDIVVEKLGPGGFTARARLGPPNAPDLIVPEMRVTFAPLKGLAAPQVRSVTLVRPVLKVRFDGRTLSFGSLQKLIDEALAHPGKGPAPDVTLEQARVLVLTPAGTVQLTGDAALPKGRLGRLTASLAPALLQRGPDRLALGGGSVVLASDGASLTGEVAAEARSGAWAGRRAQGLSIQARFAAPYPAGKPMRLDGPLSVHAQVRADAASASRFDLAGLMARVDFQGSASGALGDLALDGTAGVQATAADARGGVGAATALKLSGELSALRLRRAAGAIEGDARAALTFAVARASWAKTKVQALAGAVASTEARFALARRLSFDAPVQGQVRLGAASAPAAGGSVDLRSASLSTSGRIGAGAKGFTASVQAGGEAEGGFDARAAAGLARRIPLLGTDPASRAALASALRSARVDVAGVRLDLGWGAAALDLGGPVRLASASGAKLVLTSRSGAAAQLAAGQASGAFALALSGGGLPSIRADVASFRWGAGALDARGRFQAAGDLGAWRRASLDAAGRLSLARGRFAFAAEGCPDLTLGALVSGAKPELERVAARLCAEPGAPLLSAGRAGWRLQARAEQGRAFAPALSAELRDVSGSITAGGSGAEMFAQAQIARAEALDASPQRRFEPLLASGRAALAGGVWRGDLRLSEAKGGIQLGDVSLMDDLATGRGGVQIDAPSLAFEPAGLQPADISPLLASLGSEVKGRASFQGRVGWTRSGLSSSGRFVATGMDFRSAFGRVSQARADLTLTSLTPLVSAPDQRFTAQHIDWLIPLDQVQVAFSITPSAVKVASARAVMAKGVVSLDAISVPLKPGGTIGGIVRLSEVDLGSLFTTLGLGDVISIQAKVDGALPFSYGPAGLRFSNGRVFATGPGRLSVNRRALVAATAAPGAPAPKPTVVQDLAYQALENLAFDELEADIDSRPGGRLGIVFHIRGRHEPPKAKPARIPLLDLLRGHALDKPLPLPKGTPINLTLDTSLNFDELMAEFEGMYGAHSGAVQPGGGQINAYGGPTCSLHAQRQSPPPSCSGSSLVLRPCGWRSPRSTFTPSSMRT